MICPRCGSRDVLTTNDSEKRVYHGECQSCGHEWSGSYDPDNTDIGYKSDK